MLSESVSHNLRPPNNNHIAKRRSSQRTALPLSLSLSLITHHHRICIQQLVLLFTPRLEKKDWLIDALAGFCMDHTHREKDTSS